MSIFAIFFTSLMFLAIMYNIPDILTFPIIILLSAIGLRFLTKVKIIESLLTVAIAFLITQIVMLVSPILTGFITYMAIGPNEAVRNWSSILAMIGFNWWIYRSSPIKKDGPIVFKALRSYFLSLFFLLAFGVFAYFAVTYNFRDELFGIQIILILSAVVGLAGFFYKLVEIRNSRKAHENKDKKLEEQNSKIQDLTEENQLLIAEKEKKFSVVEYELKSIFKRMEIRNKGGKRALASILYFLETTKQVDDIEPTEAYKTLGDDTEKIRGSIDYAIRGAWDNTDEETLRHLYKGEIDDGRGYPTPKQFIEYYVEAFRD
jgi:hypothetical protein